MRASIICSAALMAGVASAAPVEKRTSDFSPNNVYFPIKEDNFPNPDTAAVARIEKQAHGTLPNGAPPTALSNEGKTNLKLIALNELSEVAFFSELIFNVTNKLPGYDLGYGHEYVMDALNAINAQEKLHLLNANGALKAFNEQPIQPCKYNFPVTDFQSAIALAGTFTDLVLGTLQDVNQIFAQNGDFGLVRGVSSVIGNEAEQEGFFRLINRKRPSSKPFMTTAAREFAFTALLSFTVPGSCPNTNTIPLKTFKGLNVENVDVKAQIAKFSFSTADIGNNKPESLKLVLINGQNKPIVAPLTLVSPQPTAGKTFFTAPFPIEANVLDGFSIAAVTSGADTFASISDVVKSTLLGPGLIEVDTIIAGTTI